MIYGITQFPSPYGVLFILMCYIAMIQLFVSLSFRLLTEYYSFLSYGQKSLLLQYFFKVLSCNIFIFEISLFISVKNIFNSSFFRYYPITIFFSNLEFYILYPSIFYPIFQEIKTIQKKNFFSFLFLKKSKGSLRISSPLKVKIFSILLSKLITSLTITVQHINQIFFIEVQIT